MGNGKNRSPADNLRMNDIAYDREHYFIDPTKALVFTRGA